MRARPKWPLLILIATILAVAGMAVGWRLVGETRADTELGRVSFELEPSLGGGAEAYVPVADWGVRAEAFDAPFRLHAELRTLNRRALLMAAEGDRSILSEAEDDLAEAARGAVVREFAWGVGVALVLLILTTFAWRGVRPPGPRPPWALLAAGGTVLAVGSAISLWTAQATFDSASFERPTYFARGAELARILEVAQNESVDSDYGSEFAGILRSISAVLTDVGLDPEPGRSFNVASDLHANALVIDPLARLLGEDPLLLAGDFGQRGGGAEAAALAPRVAALGSRVVAVSGNHDSEVLMNRLEREGVTVLRSRDGAQGSETAALLSLDGLAIAGFSDPLEYVGDDPDDPERPVTFDDLPDGEAAEERAVDELIAWFDRLPQRPDLAMVHQNGLAQALAAELFEREGDSEAPPLTIVTGDDHRQHVDRYGETIVVDGGTVGAGGIFDAGREPIGFARLHYAAKGSGLRSVDLIAVEPFSRSARASRISIESLCPESRRCTVAPGAIETGRLED